MNKHVENIECNDGSIHGTKMTKAFREGFRLGFTRASMYGIPLAAVFVLGLYLGNASHPYEVCKRMYTTPEDISECVWIKENP